LVRRARSDSWASRWRGGVGLQLKLSQAELNPILFAKLKHWLRKAAKQTVETVCDAIGQILNRVTPAGCSNYFANSGYDRR
jgi:hypothetical protein